MSATGSNTATNVSTGKPKVGGAIFVAPLGTTLPTDATSELSSAYVCLGYASEDGLKNTKENSTNDIKAWGGDVVYSSLTEYKDPFTITLIESGNVEVLKTVFGAGNVSVDAITGNITLSVKGELPPELVWVFDLATRNDGLRRIVIPDGGITEIGEVSYTDEDPIGYPLTITPYPDANGVYHKEFIA